MPTQTFCKRSFFHASSSSGNVVNEPYSKWFVPTTYRDAYTLLSQIAKRAFGPG